MNYAVAAADAYPIHMLEVVGGTELADGSPSPPDQVVPNITPGAPLSGTEPLARIMELDSIDMTTLDDDGVRGIVRFNQGNHGTFLSPASDDPEGTASLPAWLEMQLEMAFFMNSDGTTLRVTVPEVVQPDL